MYRQHERFSHPAYEASRVRRMGINAPAGYSATIRDAQHRRWTRQRDDELYGYEDFDEFDLEGPYEFEGPYRDRRMMMNEEDGYERGRRDMVYGRYGGREYDRELVD